MPFTMTLSSWLNHLPQMIPPPKATALRGWNLTYEVRQDGCFKVSPPEATTWTLCKPKRQALLLVNSLPKPGSPKPIALHLLCIKPTSQLSQEAELGKPKSKVPAYMDFPGDTDYVFDGLGLCSCLSVVGTFLLGFRSQWSLWHGAS